MIKILALNSLGFDEVSNVKPSVRGIRVAYPNSEVILVTTPRNKETAVKTYGLDDCIVYEVNGRPLVRPVRKVLALFSLIRKVRAMRFNVTAIIRTPQSKRLNPKLEIIAFLSKTKSIIEVNDDSIISNSERSGIASLVSALIKDIIMILLSKGLSIMLRITAVSIYSYFKLYDTLLRSVGNGGNYEDRC